MSGSALGHTVRLILRAYVKLYVKRQMNDAVDAGAISEAAATKVTGVLAVDHGIAGTAIYEGRHHHACQRDRADGLCDDGQRRVL